MSETNSNSPWSQSPASVEKVEEKFAKIPYKSLMLGHGYMDSNHINHTHAGSGTQEDPYIVGWTVNDPRNPLLFNDASKWLWTQLMAVATMAVALPTSAYTGPWKELIDDLGISREVFELGLSLFVFGCAVGPIFCGPLSELYGRQIVFVGTVSRDIAPILPPVVSSSENANAVRRSDRFQCWMCGSSQHRRPTSHEVSCWGIWVIALTNAGGVVADIWPVRQRGLALVAFSSAPFSPCISGFRLRPIPHPLLSLW